MPVRAQDWHQKLHNNTTPDDVPICEAYLAYLEQNGNVDAYWRVLADAGGTASFACDMCIGQHGGFACARVRRHALADADVQAQRNVSHSQICWPSPGLGLPC